MVHSAWQLNSGSSCSESALESVSYCDHQILTTAVQDVFRVSASANDTREKRRRSPRHPTSAAIRLAWTSNFDKYAMGVCVDISRTGVRIVTSDPIPVRTTVSFKSEALALSGSGTVRHYKRQNGKYVIGLEFGGGLKWLGTGTHKK
jgi:PilZ domain